MENPFDEIVLEASSDISFSDNDDTAPEDITDTSDYDGPVSPILTLNADIWIPKGSKIPKLRTPTRSQVNFRKEYNYGDQPYLYESSDYFSTGDEEEILLVPVRKVRSHFKHLRKDTSRLKTNIAVDPLSNVPKTEKEIADTQEYLYNVKNMSRYLRLKRESFQRCVKRHNGFYQPDLNDGFSLQECGMEQYTQILKRHEQGRDMEFIHQTERDITKLHGKPYSGNVVNLIPDAWPPPGIKATIRNNLEPFCDYDSEGDVHVNAFGIPCASIVRPRAIERPGYHPNEHDESRPGNYEDWKAAISYLNPNPYTAEQDSKADRYYDREANDINNDSDTSTTSEEDFDRIYWSDTEDQVQPKIVLLNLDITIEETYDAFLGNITEPLPTAPGADVDTVREHAEILKHSMHRNLYCSVCKFLLNQETRVFRLRRPGIKPEPQIKKFWCFKCHKARIPVVMHTQCERRTNNVPCRTCFSTTGSDIPHFQFTLYTDTIFVNLKTTILRNLYDDVWEANHQFAHTNWKHFSDQMYDFVKHYHYHRNKVVRSSHKLFDLLEKRVNQAIQQHRRDKAKHYLCCLYLTKMSIGNASKKKITYPWWLLRFDRDLHDRVCEICSWARIRELFSEDHFEYLLQYYRPI